MAEFKDLMIGTKVRYREHEGVVYDIDVEDESISVRFNKAIHYSDYEATDKIWWFGSGLKESFSALTIIEERQEAKSDMVNNPQHYASDEIERIDVIMQQCKHLDGVEGYLYGNIQKYIWRFENKNGIEDLKKAQWYLNKLINYKENILTINTR